MNNKETGGFCTLDGVCSTGTYTDEGIMMEPALQGEQLEILMPNAIQLTVMAALEREGQLADKLEQQIRINRMGRGSAKSHLPTYIREAKRRGK